MNLICNLFKGETQVDQTQCDYNWNFLPSSTYASIVHNTINTITHTHTHTHTILVYTQCIFNRVWIVASVIYCKVSMGNHNIKNQSTKYYRPKSQNCNDYHAPAM